jgi:hypothetical protein
MRAASDGEDEVAAVLKLHESLHPFQDGRHLILSFLD